MDEDFEIQGQIRETNTQITSSNNDKKLVQSQNQKGIKMEDQFNIKMVLLAWFFKLVSITIYLCLKLMTQLGLQIFVITIILVSFDFWTTKNITGRKLVGLRWSSRINQNGQQQWIFQSRNVKRKTHPGNQSAFWISQIIFMTFWIIIFVINLFTLSFFWVGLAYFGVMLTTLNFGCYFKCRGQHQKKAKQLSKKAGIKVAQNMF